MYCAILTLLLVNGQNWTFEDLNDMEYQAIKCNTRGLGCLSKVTKKSEYEIEYTCEVKR